MCVCQEVKSAVSNHSAKQQYTHKRGSVFFFFQCVCCWKQVQKKKKGRWGRGKGRRYC